MTARDKTTLKKQRPERAVNRRYSRRSMRFGGAFFLYCFIFRRLQNRMEQPFLCGHGADDGFFFILFFFRPLALTGKKWYNEDDIKDKEEMS